MVKKIVHYFDKLEDRIRGRLSHYPIIYTLIAGFAIVLFWRGVWITADQIVLLLPEPFVWIDGPLSVTVSVLILLITGLFVSFFINDTTILTGIKQEKKLVEKTELEVKEEVGELKTIEHKVAHIEQELKEITDTLKK